jgi:uncharacterized protein YkwD
MNTYLPSVKGGTKKVDDRITLLRIILLAGWQKRTNPVPHPLLMEAAQRRAEDMARRGYLSHTSPDGVTPNEVVRSVGYRLPDWYPEKGNNVESLYLGHDEPEEPVRSWFDSPKHHDHLVGEGKFYGSQTALGIGTAVAKDGRQIWVLISAPNTG